jgi:CheY-like chemotaxis protein
MQDTKSVVVADPSRGRRRLLEHALASHGHAIEATGSGRQALRLVGRQAARLLVSHVGVRCGEEPIRRILRRRARSFPPIQVLWFGENRAATYMVRGTGSFVCCGDGVGAIADAVDDLLKTECRSDLLLCLTKLDEALTELSDWSL